MKSIFTLLKSGIRYNKGSFISIAVLMMIIVFSFSGTVSNNDNLNRAFSESLKAYGTGDLIVTVKSEDADELVKELTESSNVKSVHAEERIAVNKEINVDGRKESALFRLAPFNSRVRVFNDNTDGFREVSPKNGDVYVSYAYALSAGISTGSEITIDTSYGSEVFTVQGFVEDPLYGSVMISAEHFFISGDDYSRISDKTDEESENFGKLEKIALIHVESSGKTKLENLAAVLNKECGLIDKSLLYINRDELSSAVMFYSNTGTKLLTVFVILLTAVVIITIYNSIRSAVEQEYVNLGILKSQGFTAWQIRTVYILQYIIALLAGTVAGIIFSVPLLSVLGKSFMQITDILTSCKVSVVKCFGISVMIIIICAVFLVLSTSAISGISPVKAINGGHNDVYFSGRTGVRIRKGNLHFLIAFRQIISRISSNISTVLIMVLLSFFMVSISLFTGSVNSGQLTDEYKNVRTVFSVTENFKPEDMDRVRDAVSEQNADSEILFYTYVDNITVNDVVYSITVSDRPEHFAKVYRGRTPDYSNEIAITEIVEKETGKHMGDSLSVYKNGVTEDFIITGIYQTTSAEGRTFIMNYEGGKKFDIKVESGMIMNADCTDSERSEITEMLNSTMGDILTAADYEMSESEKSFADIVDAMLGLVSSVVFFVSTAFAAVVVSMVCRRAVISEKRDLGIFRAVGFSDSSLRIQFALRYMILSAAGATAGAVLASLTTDRMFSLLFRSIGITNFISEFSLPVILVPSASIVICCFVFAYIASYGVKKAEIRNLVTE